MITSEQRNRTKEVTPMSTPSPGPTEAWNDNNSSPPI